MDVNAIRLKKFQEIITDEYDNSVNNFAKKHNINVNQYYAMIRGERKFGDRVARNIEKLIGLPRGFLDSEDIGISGKFYEVPLIVEGLPIPKDPISSAKKYQITNFALPDKLLSRLNVSRGDIFVVELKSKLFPPAFNDDSRLVVERFNGVINSGGYYLFNNNNNLLIYQITKQLTGYALLDSSLNEVYKIDFSNQSNTVLDYIIGQIIFSLTGGVIKK